MDYKTKLREWSTFLYCALLYLSLAFRYSANKWVCCMIPGTLIDLSGYMHQRNKPVHVSLSLDSACTRGFSGGWTPSSHSPSAASFQDKSTLPRLLQSRQDPDLSLSSRNCVVRCESMPVCGKAYANDIRNPSSIPKKEIIQSMGHPSVRVSVWELPTTSFSAASGRQRLLPRYLMKNPEKLADTRYAKLVGSAEMQSTASVMHLATRDSMLSSTSGLGGVYSMEQHTGVLSK